jgi:hypothetical protein
MLHSTVFISSLFSLAVPLWVLSVSQTIRLL